MTPNSLPADGNSAATVLVSFDGHVALQANELHLNSTDPDAMITQFAAIDTNSWYSAQVRSTVPGTQRLFITLTRDSETTTLPQTALVTFLPSAATHLEVSLQAPGSMTGQSCSDCVVLDGGNVKCWGYNPNGNLGYGDVTNRGTAANQMGGALPFVGFPSGHTAIALSTGGDTSGSDGVFACGIADDGSIYCWGYNGEGELGLGDSTDRHTPAGPLHLGARTATAVSTGGQHTCALLDDGNVTCWGYNGGGTLGVGDTVSRAVPAPTVNLGTGRSALALAAGSYHTCALLDTHAVSCWGANADGELGYGDEVMRSAPPTTAFVNLGTNRIALSISAGGYSSCALLDTHQIVCWGYNSSGQLGVGNTMEMDSPTAVLLGADTAAAISMGYEHACAVLSNDSIKCWGEQPNGELGLGDTVTRPSPSAAVSLPSGRYPIAVGAGAFYSCAQLDDASITCWGANKFGQLGVGDTANRGDTPSNVPGTYPVISY